MTPFVGFQLIIVVFEEGNSHNATHCTGNTMLDNMESLTKLF